MPRTGCRATRPAQVRQRVGEHLGGKVLGPAPIGRPAGDEGVDAIEVPLVQVGEAAGVGLRGLDQERLLVPTQGDLRRRCP